MSFLHIAEESPLYGASQKGSVWKAGSAPDLGSVWCIDFSEKHTLKSQRCLAKQRRPHMTWEASDGQDGMQSQRKLEPPSNDNQLILQPRSIVVRVWSQFWHPSWSAWRKLSLLFNPLSFTQWQEGVEVAWVSLRLIFVTWTRSAFWEPRTIRDFDKINPFNSDVSLHWMDTSLYKSHVLLGPPLPHFDPMFFFSGPNLLEVGIFY